MRCSPRRRIPRYRRDQFTRHTLPQLLIAVSRKEPSQILSWQPFIQIAPQQALDRVRNLTSWAAITNGPSHRLVQPDCSAHTKVVGVHHAISNFDLLALDANVRNPMLAATIRASG